MSLSSLGALKAFKNLATDEHDAELLRLLGAADRMITTYCRRTFEQETLTEYHSPRAGQPRLFLKRPPIVSVTSVYDDAQRLYGAASLLAASDYTVEDAEAGILTVDGHRLGGGARSVQVVYVGGFLPVPADVEQAAIELVWLSRDLGDKALLGVSGKQIADGSITMYERSRIEAVRDLLEPYRIRRAAGL